MTTRRVRFVDSTSSASSRSMSNTCNGISESDCEWNSVHYQYNVQRNQLKRIKERKELAYEVFQLSVFNYKENPNKETEKCMLIQKKQYQLQCSCYDDTEFQVISLRHMIRFGSF